MKTALILGSTGLVGSVILKELLNDSSYTRVITLVRKPQPIQHAKLLEIITDFNSVPDFSQINHIDTIFSCLGTTRKQTPDMIAYRKIEIEIPILYAEIGKTKGVQNFHYISAIGANKNASNFYLNIKGEAEYLLKNSNIPSLYIYQPSLLIGERKDHRFGEKVAAKIFPIIDLFLMGSLSKYKAMKVENLAKAMITIDSKDEINSVSVYQYDEIMQNLKK